MARFRAYSSDSASSSGSSDSESDDKGFTQHKRSQPGHLRVAYNDEKVSDEDTEPEDEDEDEEEEGEAEGEEEGDEEGEDADESEEDEDEDERSDSGSEMQGAELQLVKRDSSLISRAQATRMDPQRMHVMQTSLFRMPEEAAALRAMNHVADASLRRPIQTLRKHARESDGDIRSWETRPSFGKDVQPTLTRPTRKYARVDSAISVITGAENALADAGLSFGKSFRVGWGPAGTLVYPNSGTAVIKSKMPISSDGSLSSKLLQHHLSHSPILPDDDGVPFASPSPDMLHFSSFAALFPATDFTSESSLFRLGSALFDPLPLHLSPAAATPDVRHRVALLARKAALSTWLQAAVGPSVETHLTAHPAATAPAVAFTLLTGNQLDRACDVAIDGGYSTLATLIAQAGGDPYFRDDVRSQIRIWSEQKVDAHIDQDLRRIYALLAGDLDLESTGGVDVVQDLDWQRVFGLYLWFVEPMHTAIPQIFNAFTDFLQSTAITFSPEDQLFALLQLFSDPTCSLSQILHPQPSSSSPSPTMSQSSSWSSARMDYTLPWHLYVILSRCMRIRDFADRGRPSNYDDNDEQSNRSSAGPEFEGHSPTADLLTSTYALQLEQLGMIQEAVFVLLHLEGSNGRRKAIQDLLIRSAPKLDEWATRGLVGSLKIPMKWVLEAKAIYALNTPSVSSSFPSDSSSTSTSGHPAYTAYDLFLAAGNLNRAHDIAVLSLAPDAVLRNDWELLKTLFSPFDVQREGQGRVEGWYVRGKTFLDYANIMLRVPILLADEVDAVPDAVRATELDDLVRGIPRLIGLLPDVLSLAHSGSINTTNKKDPRAHLKLKHQVALHEMTARLVGVVDRVRPEALIR